MTLTALRLANFKAFGAAQRIPLRPITLAMTRVNVLALSLGAIVLGVFLLAEYLARPVMMHPSFAGRLNPAEEETLKRLPGIPLLRPSLDADYVRFDYRERRPHRGSASYRRSDCSSSMLLSFERSAASKRSRSSSVECCRATRLHLYFVG